MAMIVRCPRCRVNLTVAEFIEQWCNRCEERVGQTVSRDPHKVEELGSIPRPATKIPSGQISLRMDKPKP